MGRLNLEKAIEKYHKILNPRYVMPYWIMCELIKSGSCDAIYDAFALGYVQGNKAAKAEMKN